YNSNKGVVIDSATTARVTIGPSSIFGNASGWGIDLNDDGPTPNDETAPYDSDTGPNGLQNYPVITSVTQAGGNTTINGYIKSNPPFNLNYLSLALYSNSVFSTNVEGENYIGTIPPASMTDQGGGYVTFSHTVTGLYNNISAHTISIDTCGDGCTQGSSEF